MRQYDVLYTASSDDYSIIFRDPEDKQWSTWMKGIKAEEVAHTTVAKLNLPDPTVV
jgi:hypothetical protein